MEKGTRVNVIEQFKGKAKNYSSSRLMIAAREIWTDLRDHRANMGGEKGKYQGQVFGVWILELH